MNVNSEKLFNEYKKACPPVKTLVHWYDLYEGHCIKVEGNFLSSLLNAAIRKAGSLSNLSRKSDIPKVTLACVIDRKSTLKIRTLKKIATYANCPLNIIDKKIIEISNLKPNFPFNLNNKEGAEIRAAFLSDGHNTKYPTIGPRYCALEKELHKSLIKLCKHVFGDFTAKTVFSKG
jgi:hypothetical protein